MQGDHRCEVAVLGGGITGALVSFYLQQAGVDTVLLDRGKFAAGSTAASTGLLQYEIDTPLADLIAKVGEADAVHAYRRGLQAIEELHHLADDLGPQCDFSQRESLYFASSCWHLRHLRREANCRRQHGFDVDFLDRRALAAITSIDAPAAIRSRGDAQINPYAFTLSLIQQGHQKGLRCFESCGPVKCEEAEEQVVLNSVDGRLVAGHVVHATGYAAHDALGRSFGNLNSTYVVLSAPVASFTGWPDGCLIWETARPYAYARQTSDGRALIGGGDTAFASDHQRDGLVERKVAALVARFEKMFPQIPFTPAYSWAGTFAETKDGLPFIGQLSGHPRAYYALGYGGNGITFSMIAARLLTDLYRGRPNADAAVFRFGR
jgi:glycine/D-amino acid oxidase-like deaminating enzyme